MKEYVVWVSWQEHRRTSTICHKLNIPLKTMLTHHSGFVRYFILTFRTIFYISSVKPKVLIVQNPSIVLSYLSLVLQFLFRFKLIVDAHNEGVEPYINSGALFNKLTSTLHRMTDLTIVTNQGLVPIIERNGGRAIVLPDGLPDLSPSSDVINAEHNKSVYKLMLIATFVDDEPIAEIFEAVQRLEVDVELRVTGNFNKLPHELRASLPGNIILCGFLPEQEYVDELYRSDLIIDLSKKEHCLVCGAYEAISLCRPIVLSDDPAGKSLFEKGVVFSKNDPESIYCSLNNALSSIDELKKDAVHMKEVYQAKWETFSKELAQHIMS